jgi:hypothetical protein
LEAGCGRGHAAQFDEVLDDSRAVLARSGATLMAASVEPTVTVKMRERLRLVIKQRFNALE